MIILAAATSTQLPFVTKKFYDLQDRAVGSLLISGVSRIFLSLKKTILPTVYLIQKDNRIASKSEQSNTVHPTASVFLLSAYGLSFAILLPGPNPLRLSYKAQKTRREQDLLGHSSAATSAVTTEAWLANNFFNSHSAGSIVAPLCFPTNAALLSTSF